LGIARVKFQLVASAFVGGFKRRDTHIRIAIPLEGQVDGKHCDHGVSSTWDLLEQAYREWKKIELNELLQITEHVPWIFFLVPVQSALLIVPKRSQDQMLNLNAPKLFNNTETSAPQRSGLGSQQCPAYSDKLCTSDYGKAAGLRISGYQPDV
jgi:hypothetical protein